MKNWFLSIEILCFLLLLSTVVSDADINLGSTLQPTSNQNNNNNNIWRSPTGNFSLQFIPVSSSSFSVAIIFTGVPIWKAGGESGVVDSSSRFEFLNNGNLRLINGLGTIIWQSNTTNRGITVATLDNSGNLSLKNGTTTVWSSFENPTDTIVPSQNFTTRNVLTSGNYSFHLLPSGNLTLKWNNDVIYWNRGNSSVNSSLIAPSLRLSSSGIIQVSGITIFSSDYATDDGNIFRFIKMDSDGNLRIYSSVRGSGIFTKRWAAVTDQCEVYGFCGNMGICSYQEDSNTSCSCPSLNFEFTDPNEPRKGCKRKVAIEDCPGNATMLQLDHTKFLTYEPELSPQQFYAGLSACSWYCLNNPGPCQASTALSDGSGYCYLKTSSFISGYQSPALPSVSYLKVCRPEMPNNPPSLLNGTPITTYKLKVWVLVMVVFLTLVVLVLLAGWLWFWCCRNSSKRILLAQYTLLEYASGAPVQFSYKDLQLSTKGFKEKLGAGGFGAVYKGVLANRTVVAVKQLEGIGQGERQFRMEVATISNTHHLNLVRLIGFCSEGRHRLLVYEFMKNSSLDNSLFTVEETSGKLLSWESRFNIALGTARGITYLHEECRDCIIHCDIKPENILLDENYNAKVSDFGLAKLVNPNDLRYITLTSVRGTRGYLAPEWLANLSITSKSDVYSYGMVLLEIVSGRRNFEVSEETDQKKFSMWAYEEFEKGNIYNIVEKRLLKHEVDMEQIMRTIQVSFWCIQEKPSQRPKMGKVVQMLEGITTIEKPPAPKVITSESGTSINVSAHSIIEPSAPPPSSSPSFQALQIANDVERSPASLLTSTYQ